MAKINSINNETSQLTIDPGSSGDSWVQFSINGTGEFRIGVDDNDSDSFKISQGSALGTNDTFVMSAAGERTMPLQPAFLAYNSVTDADVTGKDSPPYTVIFDTEVYDQSGDYDTGTGTFTAPVTGRYCFDSGCKFGDLAAANIGSQIEFTCSNRSPLTRFGGIGPIRTAANQFQTNAEYYVDMDASDTAVCRINVTGGAANTVDVIGDATPSTYFGGYLAC